MVSSMIGPLSLTVCMEGAKASIASLAAAIERSPATFECLLNGDFRDVVLGDDTVGLLRVESIEGAATGASVLHGVRVLPDQRYLELVAAVVANGDAYVSSDIHGWPILSSVCCSTTMAEGAALSRRGPGSAEAA